MKPPAQAQTVRNNVRVNFTMIGNDALRDESLSWDTLGLLAYMLSHTGTWQFRSHSMKRAGKGNGRDAVRRMMRELQAAGYLEYRKERGAAGRISTVIVVHYPPLPEADRPGPDNPAPVRPGPVDTAPIEEQVEEDQVAEDHHNQAPPAGGAGTKGRKAVSSVLGAPPETQRDLDEVPTRAAKRTKEERPQRERKRSALDLLADRFRDATLDALTATGRNRMLLLAFNRGAMLKSFSALIKDKGQTIESLQQLIDQWAIDIRVGNIQLPENVAPWKVFLRRLDEIHARVQAKAATGRGKGKGPSLMQIMEERALALTGV
jgi:hypothetical protein